MVSDGNTFAPFGDYKTSATTAEYSWLPKALDANQSNAPDFDFGELFSPLSEELPS